MKEKINSKLEAKITSAIDSLARQNVDSNLIVRSVVAVIRHGDRTPKQKMKMEVRHPKFFELFDKYAGNKKGHVKLKKPRQLQEILDIVRELYDEKSNDTVESEMIQEKKSKLMQMKTVLEMHDFSGINRKVQLKKGVSSKASAETGSEAEDGDSNDPFLLLILKWGGELTELGRQQAQELGKRFRCMYPGSRDDKSGAQDGLGFLRLHSTYRHDLKIYASDEGRVQTTAAAFAKGLLALDGELTPIMVQMVKSANTNGLLDNVDEVSTKYQNSVKRKLHEILQSNKEFDANDEESLNPTHQISISNALNFIRNPYNWCSHMKSLINQIVKRIVIQRKSFPDAELYRGETWELVERRWNKLEKDFQNKNRSFDISKLPDIYDCIKYDLLHNKSTMQCQATEELYTYAKSMADIVIPQEYGMTKTEKLTIAQNICAPLLKKIKDDLQRNALLDDDSVHRLDYRYTTGVTSPDRHVRTRLYFTSESHIHSLLTILSEGGLIDQNDEQWQRAMQYVSLVSELNYMTQIVIMLYEDPTKDVTTDERFHVELHFSPGVNCCVQKELVPGPGFRPKTEMLRTESVVEEDNLQEKPCCIGSATPPPSPVRVSFKTSQEGLDKIFEKPSENGKVVVNTDVSLNNVENHVDFIVNDESANETGLTRRAMSMSARHSPARRLSDSIESKDDLNLPIEKGDKYEQFLSELAHIFSTDVIRGSGPEPDIPPQLSENVVFSVGIPSIRPLETLHNSMSLRHLDTFLDETILKKPGPPESEESSGSRNRANLRKLSPY